MKHWANFNETLRNWSFDGHLWLLLRGQLTSSWLLKFVVEVVKCYTYPTQTIGQTSVILNTNWASRTPWDCAHFQQIQLCFFSSYSSLNSAMKCGGWYGFLLLGLLFISILYMYKTSDSLCDIKASHSQFGAGKPQTLGNGRRTKHRVLFQDLFVPFLFLLMHSSYSQWVMKGVLTWQVTVIYCPSTYLWHIEMIGVAAWSDGSNMQLTCRGEVVEQKFISRLVWK